MDPDPEAVLPASQILKTAFISVVFSTCNYFTSEKTLSFFPSKKNLPKPDTVAKVQPVIKKKKKRTIYLTFDDGPNRGTRKVMHIAVDEKVPISMFMVGEHVYGTPYQKATLDSVLAIDMIEVCNHSWCHANNHYNRYYNNADSVVDDFERCKDSLHLTNNIARTPGRNIWRTENINSTDIKKSIDAADSLQQKGYDLIGWDLEWHFDNKLHLQNCADSLLKQIDSVFKKGKTKNNDHLVLLAHDQVYEDPDDSSQLKRLMNQLKTNDEYNIEFISTYPGIKKN